MSGLSPALQTLRNAGYKITHARRTVLEVLTNAGLHLTSADVLNQVQTRDSSIGRASVFRTLELLVGLGLIRPTYVEARGPVYVLISPQDGHHAHMICTRCHAIIEVGECHLGDMLLELAGQHQMHFTGHLLELYGLCRNCQPT